MKAKVYPIHDVTNEIKIDASLFALHIEIVLASIAKGTSTIKNVVRCNEIDTTIQWCKNLGANIKVNDNKLSIRGVNKVIKYQNSLFVCNNTSTTAKLMLAILCLSNQPFGIQASPEIRDEIKSLSSILEMFEVKCIAENEMLRFENKLVAKEVELDGDLDIYFAAGLLIALPLLSKSSSIRLVAPIRLEKNYSTILKIAKRFHVDIRHPSSMRYEINGNQHYSKAKISTEIDKFLLSHLALLTQKMPSDAKLKVNNYRHGSTDENRKLFDFIKANAVSYYRFPHNMLRKKKISIQRIDISIENCLPLFMVIGTLNDQDVTINKVDFFKPRIKKQYEIMSRIFSKLKLNYAAFEDENIIRVSPSRVQEIKQVDCEDDPIVVMAITMLALLSDVAIVIRNAECIDEINRDFFEKLKSYGAVIEYIHDR